MLVVRPYEPPPDYPLDDDPPTNENERVLKERDEERHRYTQSHPPPHPHDCRGPLRDRDADMLRARQYPEIAGLYCGEDQVPALRRFTRYNQSMMQRDVPMTPIGSIHNSPPPPPSTTFGKSSKKSSFFGGNWTFRDKKSTRPALNMEQSKRDDRPLSVNLSDSRAVRSRSEAARNVDNEFNSYRIPIRVDRPHNDSIRSQRVFFRSQPPSYEHKAFPSSQPPPSDSSPRTPIQPHRTLETTPILRKSCPELEKAMRTNLENHRVSKKRNRRGKEKRGEEKWRKMEVKDWSLDDVLLWLQHIQLDEVASLLIGYEIKGSDLTNWNNYTLGELGVTDPSTRTKILSELEKVREHGPLRDTDEQRIQRTQRSMFELVKQTSYDQVLAVETALTTRDITVTGGRMGCLQITKVDGSNLPLKENDCLLEINSLPGEQFKSALMLTKLISDSNGAPIKFVVLRRKERNDEDTESQADSSSGVSSSPLTPVEI